MLDLLRREMQDVNDLDHHYSIGYYWIPNSSSIRPSPKVAQEKAIGMLSIRSTWVSADDYILCKVFGIEYEVFEEKFRVKGSAYLSLEDKLALVSSTDRVFLPNKYPYNIIGNHWILWYGSKENVYSSQEINRDVFLELTKITSQYDNVTFDFIWYENPKKSLPEYFHVHVFWETFEET